MSGQYFGVWASYEQMVAAFEPYSWDKHAKPTPCAPADRILFATYGDFDSGTESDYSMCCHIIGQNEDGSLFYIYGSHCSCMGLEGQWEPEPTTKEALRVFKWTTGCAAFREAVKAWLESHGP